MKIPGSQSFRRQIIILVATVTALAMVLLTLITQLVLADIAQRDLNRVLRERAEAVISLISVDADTGELVVPPGRLEAGVALYDRQGALVAGSEPENLEGTYRELRDVAKLTTTTVRERFFVRAQPIQIDNESVGVVVLSERLTPYENAERYALLVSIVTGLLATVAAAVLASWVTRRALEPVADMAHTAAEWSEHDLHKRFDLGEPNTELGMLAATLDALLDRVRTAIRSEQRLTSELAHELRTPLTTIQGSADLALMREGLPSAVRRDLVEIADASRRMSSTITTLLDIARNETSVSEAGSSDLSEVLSEVTATLLPPDSPTRLDVTADSVRLGLPHDLAVRAIAPVAANAIRFAEVSVSITSAATGHGTVLLTVTDDGPGVADSVSDHLFEPGTTSDDRTGAGLGLAIARRVATSVGGDVRLVSAEPPTAFAIELPTV